MLFSYWDRLPGSDEIPTTSASPGSSYTRTTHLPLVLRMSRRTGYRKTHVSENTALISWTIDLSVGHVSALSLIFVCVLALDSILRSVQFWDAFTGLNMMCTHPQYRWRGAASLMLQWGVDRANEMDCEMFVEASWYGSRMKSLTLLAARNSGLGEQNRKQTRNGRSLRRSILLRLRGCGDPNKSLGTL